MAPTRVGIAIIVGWIAADSGSRSAIVRGQFHYVIPLWVAVYPYCYYFFSFPAERSIFTVDRALIVLLVIEMLVVSRQGGAGVPLTRDVRISAYLWGLYLWSAFFRSRVTRYLKYFRSYRLLVDGMLMPAVLGLLQSATSRLLEDLTRLHVCACILGIGLFITGLVELTTDIDLFPWNGSVPCLPIHTSGGQMVLLSNK